MIERNKIIYGPWTFTDDQIQEASAYLSTSLISDSLEANTFEATVECADKTILEFERNTPLTYFNRGWKVGIFYVQSITRIGPTSYTISATSAIGMLIEGMHYGGIYTGQTVEEVLPSICGTVPYVVKTNLRGISLYGWLPVASPRDNLSQVLFAIGAVLKTDLDGVLHIEGLWDGVSGSIGQDRMYMGPSVEYSAKVTQVIVTEHQYIQGTEEVELFDGSANEDDLITFDEPIHNLQAEGFTILESGANFAKISAGTGTLRGMRYVHNTRQIAQDVLPAREANVKTVTDATLVSVINSLSVATRLANYYKSVETILADTVYQNENTGNVVNCTHPYDLEAVSACLESVDVQASGVAKAANVLRVGFSPLPPSSGMLNVTEWITENGTWTVPENVTRIRAVLIGGGRGGWSGLAGEQPEETAEVQETTASTAATNYTSGRVSVLGGTGGEAGDGGDPGKVAIFDLDVTPGQTFSVSIGSGGAGGVYSQESTAGSDGTDTVFGTYSSASGGSNPDGWMEETSGMILAAKGMPGLNGGNGSGRQYISGGGGWQDPVDGNVVTDGQNQWFPGENSDTSIEKTGGSYQNGKYGTGTASAEGGYGGGAAYGANGQPGYDATVSGGPENGYANVTETDTKLEISARGAYGGAGADAQPFPPQDVIGSGGRGGNGGGGAGSPGSGIAFNRIKNDGSQSQGTRVTTPVYDQCIPGKGSDGSKGGPGGIVLYYAKPTDTRSVQFRTKDGLGFLESYDRRFVV